MRLFVQTVMRKPARYFTCDSAVAANLPIDFDVRVIGVFLLMRFKIIDLKVLYYAKQNLVMVFCFHIKAHMV